MNDKHNLTGFVEFNDTQYFCTVNDYLVKMYNAKTPAISGFNKVLEEDHYVLGVSEYNRNFVIQMPKDLSYGAFCPPEIHPFYTPLFIESKANNMNDLRFFSGIEFYGETLNKIYNPRCVVDYDTHHLNFDDNKISFKPVEDYQKEYDIEFGDEKAQIEIVVHSSISYAEQRNEDGSISLGSLNSAIRLKFAKSQPLEMLKHYYLTFNRFLVFLAGRHNVSYGIKLFHNTSFNSLSVSDCFIRNNNNVDIYDGDIYDTIQIHSLGNRFPDLFKLFTREKTVPLLWYLPDNNRRINEVSTANVLNICAALEIAFGMDESKDKESTVQNMRIPECKNSMLSRRILYLFLKAKDITDEDNLAKSKASISNFVILRNNIIHNGTFEWGDSPEFSRVLIQVLYINTLQRAGIDRETAIKIAETKWRI